MWTHQALHLQERGEGTILLELAGKEGGWEVWHYLMPTGQNVPKGRRQEQRVLCCVHTDPWPGTAD